MDRTNLHHFCAEMKVKETRGKASPQSMWCIYHSIWLLMSNHFP